MSAPCTITVAITGSLPGKKDNPAVPICVTGQVEAAAIQNAGKIRGPLHVQFVMGVRPVATPDEARRLLSL